MTLGVIALATGCSSDSALSQSDPRYPPIAALIAGVAENYASQGAFGLHPYMTPQVREKCSVEQLDKALGPRSDTGVLLGIEKISVDGETARATLRLNTSSGEQDVEWRLQRLPHGNWAVLEVPGSEACTP